LRSWPGSFETPPWTTTPCDLHLDRARLPPPATAADRGAELHRWGPRGIAAWRSPPASACLPPWSAQGRSASRRDGPSAHPCPDTAAPGTGGVYQRSWTRPLI
jgi:hypothetical protein